MKGTSGTKGISYNKKAKCYVVTKTKNGKTRHLGSAPTLIMALMIRDWCREHDWKPYNKNNLSNNKTGEKYILYFKDRNNFRVVKRIDGKNHYFGTYDNIGDAIICRDYYQKHNWNINLKKQNNLNNYNYYHYDKTNESYRVHKTINGIYYNYGSYKNETDAYFIVEGLKKAEWNINNLTGKYKEFWEAHNKGTITGEKYIYLNDSGSYSIQKHINGEYIYFNTFTTLEQAIQERDLLIKYGWDMELVCENYDEAIDENSTTWLANVKLMKTSFQKQDNRNDGYSYNRQSINDYNRKLKRYA